ncbi:MAG: formate--tetrahydrofolate ligase, partial [Verrucomicrobiota bacterium]|nr:formate--tetrahydrofolate ligase [Verrucomicrobiota bacterium]
SQHWLKGGLGAIDLANAVVDAANEKNNFSFLYDQNLSIKERVEIIAHEIYNAENVNWSDNAIQKLNDLEKNTDYRKMGICMVKTHLSTTHDPNIKGAISGWTLPIRDLSVFKGAGFIVPIAGDIKLMPGTGSNPGFRKIDINTQTGQITGLF